MVTKRPKINYDKGATSIETSYKYRQNTLKKGALRSAKEGGSTIKMGKNALSSTATTKKGTRTTLKDEFKVSDRMYGVQSPYKRNNIKSSRIIKKK